MRNPREDTAMGLKVIGAGLGRTGTLSLKLALERIGFGPCYHAMEVAATVRRSLPLWNRAVRGAPDWDAIFDGYAATVDYPGCCFWRELMQRYPDAGVVLTLRDPDDWFDSVHATIFSPERRNPLLGSDGAELSDFFRRDFGERIGDRAFMTGYFERWNRAVIEAVPAQRLLVLPMEAGWAPLCEFLRVPVPDVAYPRVHARGGTDASRPLPPSAPAELEARMRGYLDRLCEQAFARPA
ncbi:MAG: sulfotransferase [Pseudomonas sp.]